jgi:NAD(P)-dependent dehydrogenase (short-subunit alcohol dehydrogenase family)
MTPPSIAGRVVLVTGPARGIGEAMARRLAARGARLALVGLEPERLQALAADLGAGHAWAEADVTDQRSLERAVADVVAALGGLDVVVANAGIGNLGTVAVSPADAMARVVDVNLTGVIRTVSATLPHVTARRGHFLLVSSAAAFTGLPGLAAYAASKAGVMHFGHVLRLELAHAGVTVGVAHPLWIDTDMVRDPRAELPSFERALRALPWPFGTVTPLPVAAEALVDAVVRRRRTVYVPRALAPFAALRPLLTGALAERLVARRAARDVPAAEREMRALGRAFGAHSVEATRGAPGAPPAPPSAPTAPPP